MKQTAEIRAVEMVRNIRDAQSYRCRVIRIPQVPLWIRVLTMNDARRVELRMEVIARGEL